MDAILFTIGDHQITAWNAVLAAAGIAFVLLFVLFLSTLRQNRERVLEAQAQLERHARTEEQVNALLRAQMEIFGRLQGVGDVLSNKQSELARSVSERLDAVGQRVGENLTSGAQATAEQLQKLEARLAVIDAAQQNIGSLSEQVTGLKNILSNKQARGAFGQGRMETIVRDGLPSSGYSFQATLSNGRRPDCLIHLPGDTCSLAVDAKFPLEAFEELRRAETPEAEARAMTRLRADVGIHVKDIADKYLISGETQEVALLFVPSEALYADLHERFDDIVQKAHRARVLIVSPSLLMLAIQLVQGLVRDAQMRAQAHLIQKEVGLLLDDVRRLADRTGKLKAHMMQTERDLDEIGVSSSKIARRAERIDQLDFDGPTAVAAPAQGNLLPNPIMRGEAAE